MSGEPRRRFFAPEVIQTSAMDCGPAALKCLLEGFGIGISYGRLREACQTSVDGTSIDTIETLAQSLGLDAEQVMMPVDHLLLAESDALPAIVVVRLPSALTHFVVVWRVHGDWVQVMDPARGRRWVRRAAFLRDVYTHSLPIGADMFRDWAASDGFTRPLVRRMRALDIAAVDAGALVAAALAEPGWPRIAALDCAVRTVTELAAAGAVARGAEALRLVGALATAGVPGPSIHATATTATPAADGGEQVTLRGAVMVRVSGAAPLSDAGRAELPLELRAAVDEPRTRVWAELRQLLSKGPSEGPLDPPRSSAAGRSPAALTRFTDGKVRLRTLAAGVVLAALATVVEALLFRALFDAAAGSDGAARLLGPPGLGRGALLAAIVVLLALVLPLELPLAWGLRRAGARIEERFRHLFARKIPRLGDRYFQTRPVSDMAERAHLAHRLRALPTLAADVARVAIEIVVIAAALVWLDPGGALLTLALAAAMLLLPLAVQPALAERDLRMRNHAGALGRFYLDGLLGLQAVRTHAAEPALAREHRDRLHEWVRAARASLRAALGAEAAQALVGFGLAVALLADFFARAGGRDPGTALLAVYWALSLPMLGQELGLILQQIPAQRSLALRLLEPLGAPEEAEATGEAKAEARAEPRAPGAAAIALAGVRVVAAGHEILEIASLTIAAGEHVAIVGASGAGKSSLVGLLLGWHRPAAGAVNVDGQPLDVVALEALRRRTVWVDPSVYLWNRSLAANLAFGLAAAPGDLAAAVAEAELGDVVRRLPHGESTPLGEAGALVSGGEGQRVRFARGVLRPEPALVILDEPFRGLARDQRRELLARARRLWSGATLLCVTHDIEETAQFARVLVVAGGKIAEDAAPAALRADPTSRYAGLLSAEARVRAASWSSATWRRLRLSGGRIAESAENAKEAR
jgi:ABC-type bacteriocin/lantibiotic exporter with double-glycine peptidase domain